MFIFRQRSKRTINYSEACGYVNSKSFGSKNYSEQENTIPKTEE